MCFYKQDLMTKSLICLIANGYIIFTLRSTDSLAQPIVYLTLKLEVPGRYPARALTFVSSYAYSRRTIVSYWRKYRPWLCINTLKV